MEAIAWTAIALLTATILGTMTTFFHLSSRIDALGAGIDAQSGELRAAIDRQSTRIDALAARSDEHVLRHR